MDIPKPIRLVKLQVKPSGKAPRKKYGDNVFKFGLAEAHLMEKRGWAIVNTGREYVYMRSSTQVGRPPFVIDVAILTKEQVLDFADQCHSVGSEWKGWIGEWAAFYTPQRQCQTQEVDPFTAECIGDPQVGTLPASFHVGAPMLWSAFVEWKDDGAHYYESTKNVLDPFEPLDDLPLFDGKKDVAANAVAETEFRFSEELPLGDFAEGAAVRVEVNRYERDPEARAACIAHHGTRCLVCGFDFGVYYREIGRGFIHVHHIVPLSEIGREYCVNAITDLVPVCPNCHAMLHRRDPPLTVEQLKELCR